MRKGGSSEDWIVLSHRILMRIGRRNVDQEKGGRRGRGGASKRSQFFWNVAVAFDGGRIEVENRCVSRRRFYVDVASERIVGKAIHKAFVLARSRCSIFDVFFSCFKRLQRLRWWWKSIENLLWMTERGGLELYFGIPYEEEQELEDRVSLWPMVWISEIVVVGLSSMVKPCLDMVMSWKVMWV